MSLFHDCEEEQLSVDIISYNLENETAKMSDTNKKAVLESPTRLNALEQALKRASVKKNP